MLAFVVALALLSTGCSVILPTSDDLAGGEGGQGGGAGSSASCPGPHGRAMVDVGNYCIDSTEVTAKQYDEFVKSGVLPTKNPDPNCASNKLSYEPSQPNAPDDKPVVWVDYCDAVGFCDYAGKRLCGGADGVPIYSDGYTADAATDEWYGACTNGGTTDFRYGDAEVVGACNREFPGELANVKASAGCHGRGVYEGIYDLGGNAGEWVNVCTPSVCRMYGGAIGISATECDSAENNHPGKTDTAFNLGFRCCASHLP